MTLRMLVYSVVDRGEAGGAQIVIARLLDGLRRRGHQVTAAWGAPGPAGGDGATGEEGARDGAREWICPLHVRDPAAGGRAWHLPSLLRLALGLARRRPTIVNIHFLSEQTLYFLLLAPLFGYRIVLSVHGSDVMAPAPAWRDRLPDFLRRADAVTVVSRPLMERVLAVPGVAPAKVHLIANGIDTDFWSPGGTAPAPPHPTIVAVGRLEPVKGFDVLLEALAILRRSIPALRLCLIGDGREMPRLAAQAEALDLGDAVAFTGKLDAQGVRERLRSATAYVQPSRSEGMPLALLEAMACGLSAVATRVGGVPDVLVEGTGLLVPPEDPAALAGALAWLLARPEQARTLGQAASARARQFSATASEASYERLYRSLAGT